MTLDTALAALARRLIEEALVGARGNRARAAEALGIEERRLYRLLGGSGPSEPATYYLPLTTLGAERLRELADREGWPGVEERAAWAREARR